MLNGLIKPDSGTIEMRGRVGALIALGAGFNPILTGRENIYVNGSILGLKKNEIDEKIEDIIDFSEIRDFIDAPVQSYSSGMNVRLGFAVATALNPDILILDEVLAVGDMGFHAKCFKRIGEMTRECAVIFVSHDLSSVARICDRSFLLSNGKIKFHGSTFDTINQYNESLRNNTAYESTVETHDAITDFNLKIIREEERSHISPDESVIFELCIGSSIDFDVGRLLLSFYLNGATQVAQIDLSNRVKRLHKKKDTIRISVPNLNLASGHYTINLAMFGLNKRETLIHAIHCAEIKVEGLPFLGSAYKIPTLISRSL
jgi:lipopolysaccharide transport system ATP-binding protein